MSIKNINKTITIQELTRGDIVEVLDFNSIIDLPVDHKLLCNLSIGEFKLIKTIYDLLLEGKDIVIRNGVKQ